MKYDLRVVTAPPYYPVSRAQAKLWCRIDTDDTSQDDAVDGLIAAMTEYAENYTGRSFVERSYELLLPFFSCHEIEIPRAPLLSVDYVKYYDTDNVLQTIAAADYEVNTVREPGLLRPVYLESWPSTYSRYHAVQIGFTAGYAPGSPADEAGYREAVPELLKQWIKARISTLFENREQLVQNNKVQIPWGFGDGLLDSLIILGF